MTRAQYDTMVTALGTAMSLSLVVTGYVDPASGQCWDPVTRISFGGDLVAFARDVVYPPLLGVAGGDVSDSAISALPQRQAGTGLVTFTLTGNTALVLPSPLDGGRKGIALIDVNWQVG